MTMQASDTRNNDTYRVVFGMSSIEFVDRFQYCRSSSLADILLYDAWSLSSWESDCLGYDRYLGALWTVSCCACARGDRDADARPD